MDDNEALAYFITFTTYGTWLHGRDPGSVDRKHNEPGTPFLPPNEAKYTARVQSMVQVSYTLDIKQRELVLKTIQEVAAHRSWKLWAVHVRTNHVHIVVQAEQNPEKVMSDFKAWASRRLREAFNEPDDRNRWTRHGSTRWINSVDVLEEKISYVLDEQGKRMAWYDGRKDNNGTKA